MYDLTSIFGESLQTKADTPGDSLESWRRPARGSAEPESTNTRTSGRCDWWGGRRACLVRTAVRPQIPYLPTV